MRAFEPVFVDDVIDGACPLHACAPASRQTYETGFSGLLAAENRRLVAKPRRGAARRDHRNTRSLGATLQALIMRLVPGRPYPATIIAR